MNAQHSSKTDLWYTPLNILECVRQAIPVIDLDPASDEFGNSRVKAINFYSKAQNGLSLPWAGNVFVNPPGGKIGNRSQAVLFWNKLFESPNIDEGIFLGFSLEMLQTTQSGPCSMGSVPFCIPRRRIRFDSPDGGKSSPTHANVIVYLNFQDQGDRYRQKRALFSEVFSSLGTVVCPSLEGT